MKPKTWTIIFYDVTGDILLRKEAISSEQMKAYDKTGITDGYDHFLVEMVNAGYLLADWNLWVKPKILIFKESRVR